MITVIICVWNELFFLYRGKEEIRHEIELIIY